MSETVKVVGLNYFHGKEQSLKDVSFTLEKGKVYGLWGRNGAGKTTLMRCIAGLSPVDEETISVREAAPFDNDQLLGDICFIQENHPLNPIWRVKDALEIASWFQPEWDESIAQRAINAFRLKPTMRVKKMSKGMKTALALSIGLASNAKVTIFDEPTNGLDAAFRETFYELLMKEHEKGERLFVISTHYIQELQRYMEQLLVIHQGELVLNQSLEEIRGASGYIHGKKEELSFLDNNSSVIEVKEMGAMVRYMVEMNEHTEKEISEKIDQQVELQDYLLRKTEIREGEAI